MNHLSMDLRSYLRQNHNQLTWEERIQITFDIVTAFEQLHNENVIHGDLHPGNVIKRT